MSVRGSDDVVALTLSENMDVSGFKLMQGEPYDEESADGMWLSDSYAAANDVNIGDELTLTYKEYAVTGKVRGLIKASEYLICLIDDTQLMPDYSTCGYVYVAPAMLEKLVDEELKSHGALAAVFRESILNSFFAQMNVKSMILHLSTCQTAFTQLITMITLSPQAFGIPQ